ncbi:MAG: hypothetical protein KIT14_08675 [bacterium]|nr:hypothetical protein [bacterium]
MRLSKHLVPVLVAGVLAGAPQAFGHATYNVSGYGSGLGGSTNGVDGMPANASSLWTNGPVDGLVTALPVMWYAGMHGVTTARTIQTGTAPAPSGSLLAQIESYNAENEPDLPTDAVLAVGGKSWTDPDNDGQGWGHGLDYGLIHVSPLEDLRGEGLVSLTLNLADDPNDGATVRLAIAVYGGWDTGAGAVRHQTFVTAPSPVDDPLGTTGLELLGFAIASAAGQPVTLSIPVTPTYEGHYSVFVGALDGVAGQYTLTISPVVSTELAQCTADLAEKTSQVASITAELAAATADADGDGVRDAADACADTPAGAVVDARGCSQAQFCGAVDVSTKAGRNVCKKSDWNNDEPLMKKKQADCRWNKATKRCEATTP